MKLRIVAPGLCVVLLFITTSPPLGLAAEIISDEALVPPNEQMIYGAIVNFLPPNGAQARVNPPRFRWFYVPDPSKLQGSTRVLYKFRLQIASEPTFANPLIDVVTDINFYNELAPLPEDKTYYWRVGYMCQLAAWNSSDVVIPQEQTPSSFSDVRSFTIAPGTPQWDRSVLQKVDLGDHPRMLFRKDQLVTLRRLIQTDPIAKVAFEDNILPWAERIMSSEHWDNWPDNDKRGTLGRQYYRVGKELVAAAFAYKVTGDPKYRNVIDIFAKIATFPRGGASSPEGMGGDSNEDSTSFTEFLALGYDWLGDEMTPQQREGCVKSLEWRIKAWMNDFRWGGSWYTRFRSGEQSRLVVRPVSLFMAGGDHQWEGTMATFPAAIAIYDESEIARKFFHMVVNYLIAVSERPAQNGCPDQGLSYGQSHLKWLMYQTYYLCSALPQLRLDKNPHYRDIGRYYLAVTPVGLRHAPWGRYDPDGSYRSHRHEALRLLALLTGDGVLLKNWQSLNPQRGYAWRPWVHVAAPLLFPNKPTPQIGDQKDFLFATCGWAMSHTYPPTDKRAYTDGVGVIFAARPVIGTAGNVFLANNAFQLYGYGEPLNYGGGPSGSDPQPFHTMSHNTILVDGLGQARGGPNAYALPIRGAIIAHKKGEDYWYVCGDATDWYPKEPFQVGYWVVQFDKNVYGKLAVPYLRRFRRHLLFMRDKYVVVFDDLATGADHPARFSWLWHVKQDGEVKYDPRTARVVYQAGEVKVLLQHIAHPDGLKYHYAKGLDGMKNPLTGEDFTKQRYTVRAMESPRYAQRFPAHHFWFTNSAPTSNFGFLTVIYPVKPGGEDPKITRLDDLSVKVEAGGNVDIISFDPDTHLPVTHVVDLPAMRAPIKFK